MTHFGPQETEKFFQTGAKCFLGVFFDARSKKSLPKSSGIGLRNARGSENHPKVPNLTPPWTPLELEPTISDPHNGIFSENMGDLGQDRTYGNSGS